MRPAESFIGQPVRSLQTMLRVIAEDNTRYQTVIPDGIYGPNTMQAVSAFQRQNGIPITGITDQITWDRIVEIYESAQVRIGKAEPIEILLDPGQILKLGDSNPYIYLLQSMLTQLSKDYPNIPAPNHNGILDKSTVDALLAFQKLAELEATGDLDLLTWRYLVLHFTLNVHHNQRKERDTQQDVGFTR